MFHEHQHLVENDLGPLYERLVSVSNSKLDRSTLNTHQSKTNLKVIIYTGLLRAAVCMQPARLVFGWMLSDAKEKQLVTGAGPDLLRDSNSSQV